MIPDIERLAKEAGFIGRAINRELLAKFAALVAEECAKECDSYVWWENDGHSPDEGNIRCAAAIRAKFALSNDKPEAK